MKQPMYIRAATAISPQQSLEREKFLKPLLSTNTGKLYAIEASYAQYINPVAIRRMSRIMKITISAAMQCLKEAGVKTPDAIITGTGRGGVTDMEVFVKDMIRLDEEALNPTAFIQSTYNSPNGWIAMQSGSTGYNQTYVHRGCSFELALLDAQMLLAEATTPQNILVGCYDEMTENYYNIRSARNYWKKDQINSADLLQHSYTAGTIGGEGASFFVLSNMQDGANAAIMDVQIVHQANGQSVKAAIENLLIANGLAETDIALVVNGLNGDNIQSKLYEPSLSGPLKTAVQITFKHISGEYDTATGFALWMAENMIREVDKKQPRNDSPVNEQRAKKLLIINHYLVGAATLMLISPLKTSLTHL